LQRNVDNNFLKTKKVSVITGIRRCGKSTLLKQISKNYEKFFYLNFEDERLFEN
jgi:predicted AAA+ superfamily ATPase